MGIMMGCLVRGNGVIETMGTRLLVAAATRSTNTGRISGYQGETGRRAAQVGGSEGAADATLDLNEFWLVSRAGPR